MRICHRIIKKESSIKWKKNVADENEIISRNILEVLDDSFLLLSDKKGAEDNNDDNEINEDNENDSNVKDTSEDNDDGENDEIDEIDEIVDSVHLFECEIMWKEMKAKWNVQELVRIQKKKRTDNKMLDIVGDMNKSAIYQT